MAHVIEDTLPLHPRAPAVARELVRGLSIDEETRRTLELVVSELVTNSVVHGDGESDEALALRIRCESAAVSGEICGPGEVFAWERHEPDLASPGGLGLLVVDSLVERWGISTNGGTCVWFECVAPGGG